MGAGAYRLSQSCFTADMLLETEDGKRRADTIQLGDRLWSRSEFDPAGPVELRTVEEEFVRFATPILSTGIACGMTEALNCRTRRTAPAAAGPGRGAGSGGTALRSGVP